MTEEFIVWKQRFDALAALVEEAIGRKRIQEISKPDKRIWVTPDLIYVSFDYDVVHNEKKAKELWGDKFDVYRLWKPGPDAHSED